MVVSLKHLFTITKIGQTPLVPAPAPAEPAPFSVGDTVRLKPNDNPYKGTLKCGKSYTVQGTYTDLIRLVADNGTHGYFRPKYFEPYTTDSADIAADEYNEAILAQEIMEQQ